MADSNVPLNPGAGPLAAATVTDASGYEWQKIVLGQEASAGTPSLVTTASPLPVTLPNTSNIQGPVAASGANSGNPVKVGGVYNTSPPTLTNGQIGDAQLDANGYLCINIKAGAAAGGTSSNFNAAYPSAGTAIGMLDSNGTNMVALNADASGFLKVNVAAGAAQAVVDNSTGWTSGASQALPIAAFYATSPTALTSGDFGVPLLAKTRQQRVVLDADANANGGLTMYSLVQPATPAATAIKASAGQVAFIHAINNTSGSVYVKFFNVAAGSVTLTSTAPLFQIGVPGNTGGAGVIISLPIPAQFSTAISYATTGAIALLDNTSITATSVSVTIGYA